MMSTPPIDARALAASGMEALRRGDARAARDSFERIVGAGQADAASCLALAHACRLLEDGAGALAAIERALTEEPRNVRALIMKADHLAQLGDARAASSFYLFAVQAAPPPEQIPPDLRRELGRAQAMCERYARQFEDFLMERLDRIGLLAGAANARFRQSLDIMLGKKTVHFQQPQTYYFPELPQIQFYQRSAFPWLDRVEAATAAIRDEVKAILAGGADFRPYVEGDPKRPRREKSGMQDNPDWSAFYLRKFGEPIAANVARCPKTMDALADAPLARVTGRSPSVLYSQLRAGARIPPHCGLVNTRLICHLPLIVPPDCALRVGNDVRTPVEGNAWVFDDTIEHEAWNRSDRTRVILLFEIWRPELTEEERGFVSAMFEAIDAYSGKPPAWGI